MRWGARKAQRVPRCGSTQRCEELICIKVSLSSVMCHLEFMQMHAEFMLMFLFAFLNYGEEKHPAAGPTTKKIFFFVIMRQDLGKLLTHG